MEKRKIAEVVKRARRNLPKPKPQAELVREAKAVLGVTTAELAAILEMSKDTVHAWLQSEGTAKYRAMPEGTRSLLAQILVELKK